MFKKYLLYTLIIFLLIPQISLAAGADKIFLEIGQDKPAQWDNWSRTKKHNYYKSLGIYPDSTGHYSGKTGDLDTYFELLGKTEPANWSSMTFAEKKKFVSTANDNVQNQDNGQVEEKDDIINQSQIDISQINAEAPEENKKIPYIYFVIFGISLGSIMILGAYKTD